MISFFKWKSKRKDVNEDLKTNSLVADMHSHILPGIDDGAATLDESLALIQHLMGLGYKKLITTPHIMGDFFKNTPAIIHSKLDEVKNAVALKGWQIELHAAAEYYLDEWLIEKLNRDEPLLTFGNKYLLFETSYINQPAQLKEAIFLMQSQNYKPVLAHPERYMYLQENFHRVTELYENGVLMQVNINSLTGYYSVPAQLLAEKLIELKMIHFAGTDCHTAKHIKILQDARSKKYYNKLLASNLLNITL